MLQLKTPYRDGTTHLVLTPLEFLQRRAALVPRPRLHLMMFVVIVLLAVGVFPSSSWADKKGGRYGHDPASKLEKLTKKLSLTEEQPTKILPILEEKSQKMKALHEQMKEARQQAVGKIEAELTPAQAETYKKMRQERRKTMQEYWDKGKKGHKKGKHHKEDDHD